MANIIQNAENINPGDLELLRIWVLSNVPHAEKNLDRRGYQLIQWPSPIPNEQNKPIELSLEHEVRLLPHSEKCLANLRDKLYLSESKQLGGIILPDKTKFNNLVVRKYQRATGAQSIDHYYDTQDLMFTQKLMTVRERRKTSSFMTWSSEEQEIHALNMELPFFSYGTSGLTIRLEFNWVGDLQASWEQTAPGAHLGPSFTDPFQIVFQHYPLQYSPLSPIIEHTTFREKFGFHLVDGGTEQELFVLNIDQVIAQSLIDHRICGYVEIDISAIGMVDQAIADSIIEFSEALSEQYDLKPNFYTKALHGAVLLGMIDE